MPPTQTSKAPKARNRLHGAPALWRMDAGRPMPAAPFVALVPGSEAPLVQLSLPAGLKRDAREKVALRQAQDRLGARPGSLIIRPARLGSKPDEWRAVIVADSGLVAGWRAQVAGARCRAILPDYLGLPASPELWTVELAEAVGQGGAAMVRVRLGTVDGFSAEPALAAMMLRRARAEVQARSRPAPLAVLRLGPSEATLDDALDGLEIAHGESALPGKVSRPRLLGHGELALDLATDPALAAARLAARLQALRLPAAMLILGLFGWLGGEWAETARLNAHADAIETANLEVVRRDFVPSGPILDIEAQVSREIARRREGLAPLDDGETPLARLRRAAEVIAEALDADPTQAPLLNTVIWRADADMQIALTLADFAALDALMDDLRAAGLSARVGQSAAEAGGRVGAEITIGGGAAR